MKSFHLWFLGMGLAFLLGFVHHMVSEGGAVLAEDSLVDQFRSGASDWIGEMAPSSRGSSQQPVLVILADSQSQLHRLRSQLGPRLILASSTRAIALRGGSIIASDPAAASDPINQLGWGDRPLEIVSPRSVRPAPTPESTDTGPDPARSLEVIRNLSKKDSLTRSEAMLLLDHIQ